MHWLDSMVVLKILTFIGMCMTGGGTILLWRSSPSGYALSGYGGGTTVSDNKKNNQRMLKKQTVAVITIVVGTALQAPLLIYS